MYAGCCSTDVGSLVILQCHAGRYSVVIQLHMFGQRFRFFPLLVMSQTLSDNVLWRSKLKMDNFFDIKKEVIMIIPLVLTFVLFSPSEARLLHESHNHFGTFFRMFMSNKLYEIKSLR
jgi:hypothetical protein